MGNQTRGRPIEEELMRGSFQVVVWSHVNSV